MNPTLRRLLWNIPVLLLIVTLAFGLVRLAPGGPFDQEQALAPDVKANLDRAYGLDLPLSQQYGRYLWRLAHGDLGPSMRLRDFSVNELLSVGLPVSLSLGAFSLLLSLGVGVPIGLLAAYHRGHWLERVLMPLMSLGVAIPSYVTAPTLALVFGLYLHWLPVAGWEPGETRDLVLPVIALSLPTLATVARLTRASALEVLELAFLRTARAKGLSQLRTLVWHLLPPTLVPVLAYLGPATAAILTGSLVVETVFGLPGMGRYLVQGALNRDYTVVLGQVIVYATLILVINAIVDVLQGFLDPRLALGVRDAGRA